MLRDWYLVVSALTVVAVLGLETVDLARKEQDSAAERMQRVSERLNCALDTSVNTEAFTESDCAGGGAHYRVLTFAEAKDQRQWLDLAKDYGGTYVSGDRWVVVPWPDSETPQVCQKLGGVLENGDSHMGMTGPVHAMGTGAG
ncbi:hypothetical protein [Kitasatospora sp. NPDC089509]|uniref:hypothetical protein n=1 Tax=Kitasatospora sp. NPDC089509 TaxID=3364079 RepID=UPI00381F46A0